MVKFKNTFSLHQANQIEIWLFIALVSNYLKVLIRLSLEENSMLRRNLKKNFKENKKNKINGW